MTHSQRLTRKRQGRSRFRLEGLESRYLCTVSAGTDLAASAAVLNAAPAYFANAPGTPTDSILTSALPSADLAVGLTSDAPSQAAPVSATLTVLSTDPAPGAVLTASPTSLTVTFDRPIDPFSPSVDDVFYELQKVDGSWTRFDIFPIPGADPTQLVLPVDQGLAPGSYRIVLSGAASVQGTDKSMVAGTDQILASFSIVAHQGVTLEHAIPVLPFGADPTKGAPTVTRGALDFATNPYDYRLYKVTLPAGHIWAFGAEVSAQRDGGTLNTALALFDDQGTPIATDDLGRAGAPSDPYLFAGLRGGTYYIGVSGANDLPGLPGGYDPMTGATGSVVQTQAGGPFRLHLAAVPNDAPIHLLGFSADQADPLDLNPTGVTLQFSGALRLSSDIVGMTQNLNKRIEVVDAAGTSYPVTASSYSESQAKISFLFQDALPEGHYTVRLPAEGGLVDLSGQSPVAPGEPSGVLGTFDVGPAQARSDPNDFGPLRPSLWEYGIAADATLDPGASATYRFVVLYPSQYVLQTSDTTGTLALAVHGASGQSTADPNLSSVATTHAFNLTTGVYTLHLTGKGAAPKAVHWTLRSTENSPDSILANGVGQGPGLDLLLIAPTLTVSPSVGGATSTPSTPAPSFAAIPTPAAPEAPTLATPSGPTFATPAPVTPPTVTASQNTPGTSGTTSVASPGTPGGAAEHAGPAVTPSSTLLTLGGALVGSPTSQAEHVAAVGPGSQSGSTALALNSPGLLQGIAYGSTARGLGLRRGEDAGPGDLRSDFGPGVVPGAPIARRAASDRDARALATSEWIGRLGEAMGNGFEATAPAEPEGAADPVALSTDDRPRQAGNEAGPEDEQEVQHAGFAAPLTIGVATVLAMRLHRPFRKWLGRRTEKDREARKEVFRATARGPHLRVGPRVETPVPASEPSF